MSDNIFFIISFAIIIEALIEYVKGIINSIHTKEWRTIIIQMSALAIGITVCCIANVNLFSYLGFDINVLFGRVITGVFASRGSNYIHDLIKKLQPVDGD
jgi:hypothetical protein